MDHGTPPQAAARESTARAEDRALVEAILAGSTESWHRFIQQYSRLILAVIHRYVPRQREDEARTLYASVLETLYRVKLAGYEGRAALSTWVVLVTRSMVVDDLRKRWGGRDLHEALKALGPFEREVFQHYYVEGLSFGAVRRLVRDGGALPTTERLLAALRLIEERVRGRVARRLSYDLHAQSVGGASGRLLEYLDHARFEFEERADHQRADFAMLDREARRTLLRVQAELEKLPAEERRLLTLRFERGWTARRIAAELGLQEQRSVYTWIDRIVRTLRRRLSGAAAEPRATAAGLPARIEPTTVEDWLGRPK